ncbi:MAG: acylphosphatase [Syntrophales bacterium]|nr:acylphosphatase [Syntrophales bacterium]
MRRVHVHVSGRVQGVAFRARASRTAQSLNLSGWVKNLPDGRVEAVFQGRDEDVVAMVDWCRRGPALALVERLEAREEPLVRGEDRFEIRF